jgi:hypothetical protein
LSGTIRVTATGKLVEAMRDPGTLLQSLKLNAGISQRGDTEELYFDDPDGISVQIQDTRYRGGVGRLGDRDPT